MGLLRLNGGEKEWRRVFPDLGLGYRRKPFGVAKTTRKLKMPFGEGAAVTERLAKLSSPECVWGKSGQAPQGTGCSRPQKVTHRIAT